jgi:hypothetical protein
MMLERSTKLGIMRGLNPRIHQLKFFCEETGLPGQARQ